jgi:hypothetical protein
MNPFNPKSSPLTVKGDLQKGRKRLLTFVKIMHGLCIALVPLAIILVIILKDKNIIPFSHKESYTQLLIIVSYIISIILLFLGYKCTKIFFWMSKSNILLNPFQIKDVYLDLTNFHNSRIINFLVVVTWSFILGLMGINLLILLPLFILSGIALILTYPTDKRWAIWLHQMPKTR